MDFMGPIMGSLKSSCTTFYRSSIATIALNCLVFEKIAFFAFWQQTDRQIDRQTDKLTDGQHRCSKPAVASGGLKMVVVTLSEQISNSGKVMPTVYKFR